MVMQAPVGGPARGRWNRRASVLSRPTLSPSISMRRTTKAAPASARAFASARSSPRATTSFLLSSVRPLWVRLLGGKRPLVAGQSTELVCQAVGARPKPNISWWKGGTRLKNVRETISSDGNVTSSILTFVPSIDDAGRVLSCRAIQPRLPHSTHEDGWKLEIQHLPVVKLELGANLDADKVIEGSDVYLDCMVRANPWHSHVYFTHNGAIIKPGPGVVLANQSLVLQRMSRKATGGYVCVARNSLGEGYSDPLVLEVKYAPTCKSHQATIIRAARSEVVDIMCEIDANPMEPMTYQWWFNSSTQTKLELNTFSTNSQNNLGRYLYTVNTSSDYGWVQCTGTNSVGRQNTPCLFHTLPAEKPSSVKNCEITNMTYDSLTLGCSPGHDGGMKQSFLLQVYDISTGILLRNITSEEPQFIVWGLSGSTAVGISVRGLNKKGLSEPFTLTSNLLKHPQRHTANVPVRVDLTTVLVSVLVAVAVIAILTAISAVILCWKYCNKDVKNEKINRKQDEISNIPLTGTNECESVDSLDKNPDIIPIKGKISDNCSNKSSATDYYSSIRPLLSKSDDKYDHNPTDRHYDHGDPCSQYVQVRPLDFRVHQYQHGLQMANVGQPVPGIGMHMRNIGPNECRPYDKVYENWLKYKNSLPLNTSGLLPVEQLMPPELYTPSIYTTSSRNPLNLSQTPGLEPSCDRRSPPVRVNAENNSAYYNVDRHTHTLPLRRPGKSYE
ncbi:unnamed protein product [Danaus chrysippus]|uniref:(African queen) hypothetical protein n=1 Tax=Danaus chrysippus TaxID=151541 RepID=A0A8J2QVQ1_9NEOP|nr:unnamed protein product [Danaus chrysippus]